MRIFYTFLALLFLTLPAHAAEPIVIGEFASATDFAHPVRDARRGWQLALEEINAAGGVLGRPLEVLTRDDKNDPAEGVLIAEEYIHKHNVVFLFGGFLDHVVQAVSNVALQNEIGYMKPGGGSSNLVWKYGHPYVSRVDVSTDLLARIFAAEAAKTGKKRWAIIAPNYEYGRAMAADFKKYLLEADPSVEFVVEQYPALGKINAGAELGVMSQKEADGFLFAVFGKDLIALNREMKRRGILTDAPVIAPYFGHPHLMAPHKDELPIGWITQGYPADEIDTPAHKAFLEAYLSKYQEAPDINAFYNYVAFHFIADAIEKAGSTDRKAIAQAVRGLERETIVGPLSIRAIDGQSTLGAWVGKTALVDGKPRLVDWHYLDGSAYMPTDEEVMELIGETGE